MKKTICIDLGDDECILISNFLRHWKGYKIRVDKMKSVVDCDALADKVESKLKIIQQWRKQK